MEKEILQNIMLSSGDFDAEKDYWLDKLAGELTVSGFPIDMNRPRAFSADRETRAFAFDGDTSRKLLNICNSSEFGLFVFLLSGVTYLLYRYTGNEDVLVGAPVIKQGNDGTYLNNKLVLRNQADENMTFREFLMNVKNSASEAYKNVNYPLAKLAKLLNLPAYDNRNSVFDVMVLLKNIHDENMVKDDMYDLAFKFDMCGEGINFEIEYNRQLYFEATISRLAGHVKNFFSIVMKDPQVKLSEIDFLSDEEKYQLLHCFNNTETAYPKEKTIQMLFEEQVARTPDNIAVIFGERKLTYRELNEKSNKIANMLIKDFNVCTGDIVGLCLPRSLEMVAGIIGIMKANAVCLPIDLRYPPDRINMILEDSKAKLVIWHPESGITGENTVETVNIDIINQKPFSGQNICSSYSSESPAYLIYTSGSTGKPKGVLLNHYGINNHTFTKIRELKLNPEEIYCHNLSINFVASIWQVFAPLFLGAKMVIYSEDIMNDGPKLISSAENDGVSVLEVVPSLLKSFLENIEERGTEFTFKSLRALVLTGEKVEPSLVNKFYKKFRVSLINAYGQSECSDDTLHYWIPYSTEARTVPIGRPSNNTQVYIVNRNNKLQPVGVQGELCISGDGLASGYLRRPEMDAEKFVQNPFSPNKKMYRTGDLARWLPGGEVEFIGRVDNQVKIRGFRIELGEIETQLLKHELVKEAVVASRQGADGNNYLCAYIVADELFSIKEIRGFLQSDLPEYMIPAYFMTIDKLPLTPNGKVDRKALPEPEGIIVSGTRYVEPRNEVEMKLQEIWEKVLGIKPIGIDDSFFDIGGHSLTVIKVEVEMEKNNLLLNSSDIYKYKTIRNLAEFLESSQMKDEKIGEKINGQPEQKDYEKQSESVMESNNQSYTGVMIDNIEPFSEFFYKSCLFNSLFPVIRHFNREILPIIANDIIMYRLEKGNATEYLSMEYAPLEDVLDVIEGMGLSGKVKVISENIIEDIKTAITNGRPVIVWIDCFYESMRADTYMKRHHPHTLLVYGFNDEKDMFHVVEHRNAESQKYGKYTVPYNVLLDSYKGYLENYQNDDVTPSYYELFEKDYLQDSVNIGEDIHRKSIEAYRANILKHQEDIRARIEHLNTFCEKFTTCDLNPDMYEQALEAYISGFNDIINAKQIERDKLKTLFSEDTLLVENFENILAKWEMVRMKTVKYLYSNSYNQTKAAELGKILKELYSLEVQFLNDLLNVLKTDDNKKI